MYILENLEFIPHLTLPYITFHTIIFDYIIFTIIFDYIIFTIIFDYIIFTIIFDYIIFTIFDYIIFTIFDYIIFTIIFDYIIFISNTMTLEKLVIKCPREPREDLWRTFTNPLEARGDI